jgi:hypothetical protein
MSADEAQATVTCPFCHAPPTGECHTPSGKVAATVHPSRLYALAGWKEYEATFAAQIAAGETEVARAVRDALESVNQGGME